MKGTYTTEQLLHILKDIKFADVEKQGFMPVYERDIEFVVLVGGSALDFEVPTLVTDALSQYNIVAGRGNIRGCEGPRNAVATGLAMSCADV